MQCRRVLLIAIPEVLAFEPEEVMRLGVDGEIGVSLNKCSPRSVVNLNAP